jgi:hypothetical protein
MSTTGLLFVTAPEADYKAVNLLIHHLRDWEYFNDANDGLNFHLVTTKNAYDLELAPGSNHLDATPPALDATLDNGWAGATLKDVEASVSISSTPASKTISRLVYSSSSTLRVSRSGKLLFASEM